MKKLLLVLLLAVGSFATVQAQEIKWMSLDEALAAQKKKPKPIFMDVYTDWCGPCKMLDKNTFSDQKVIKAINEKYNAVKFNAEGNEEFQFGGKLYNNPSYQEARKSSRNGIHQFTSYLQVPGYPTMAVIDSEGKVTKGIVGYKTPDQLIQEL